MRKSKVLHISYGGIGNGGVSSVIISIVESLYRNFDFGCVTFSKNNSRGHIMSRYARIHNINCYGKIGVMKILEIFLRPFIMYFATKKICKENSYDIIHCHNGADMVFCLLAAKHAGIKKRIAHSHNSLSPIAPPFYKHVLRQIQGYFINKLATHRVGCSSLACKAMFENYESRVILNSIDISRFTWDRVQHKGLEIVHVGRYDYPKNQSFIIDVVNHLKDDVDELHVRLIGFGKDEMMLKEKVDKLKLNHIISFEDGRHVDIHSAFAIADIMVFPSEYEGFGIVLIEAQATGCYCFASDVVPEDTNIGLMEQLSLNLSSKQWANRILEYWKMSPCRGYDVIKDNIKEFDNSVISKLYSNLYEE